ncbi:ABC transporter permease [Candidatus Marinarcus aquaticus]|uniref:ABC transporter permease n=1 Tax=Candidatus Marinarcus aquaticus TaxID=2044504 RepID=A0A4Q0XUN1_9BACT|nr:ABC transporter permease [Candidatus Marinarcus aquaticus]RXJ58151.1 ABC transporter permease [Candidatus Marinarcus aquaticus]
MRQALKALKANRLKTLLIYLSLIFSITSIFLITAISNGVISMYSSILKSDGDIIVTQAKISDTFFSNVNIQLLDKIDQIEGVVKSSAIIVGATPVEQLPIVAVYGVSQNRFSNYTLTQGNYPQNNEVMLGESVYKNLMNKTQVTIANKSYKIAGVFKSDIGFENGGVVLNIEDASALFNKSASMLMVNTQLESNIDDIKSEIEALSSEIEATSTQNFVENYNQFKIIKTSSYAVSLIAFCMGLLSIVSIMSITINQRKTEFGIKRAIGISMRKIIAQIVSESFILGFLSYISAFFIAHIVLFIIKQSTTLQGYVNGEISSSLALFIFSASIAMSIIGSIIPALNASKTDPVILIQGTKI